MFILSGAMYRKLERLIANFLWTGSPMKPSRLKVPWVIVTRPRKEGGLGVKKLAEWNRAAALKHLWLILSEGRGSIWVEWVKVYLLRGRSLWLVSVPSKCSWVWKNLLALRHQMKALVAWRMGDGSRISFWQDPWLPCGPLLEVLGAGFRGRVGIPLQITVQEFYHSNIWQSFVAADRNRSVRSKAGYLTQLAALIPVSFPGAVTQQDSFIWLPNDGSGFTIKTAWEAIRRWSPRVPWRKVIWHRAIPPRFSFLLWTIMQNKLPTRDRLANIEIASSDRCSICLNHQETVSHLFFECEYSQQVWTLVMEGVGNVQPVAWSLLLPALQLNPLLLSAYPEEFLKRFAALTYYLWMERNHRIF